MDEMDVEDVLASVCVEEISWKQVSWDVFARAVCKRGGGTVG